MLINFRRTLAAIVSVCNLHVFFFYQKLHRDMWVTKEICRPFNLRKASIDLRRWEKYMA
jgi:hypothetical protein